MKHAASKRNRMRPLAGGVNELFGADANRYDDRHYGGVQRTFIGDRQRFVVSLLETFDLPIEATLLDVACGPGRLLAGAAHLGLRSYGVDRSHDMLRTASENVGPNIPLAVGDAQGLPFASHTFDVVNCSGMIEYLPDPSPALQELLRVAKPGGRVLVSSTNSRSPALAFHPLIARLRRSHVFKSMVEALRLPVDAVSLRPRDFEMTYHTHDGLRALMQGAGFRKVEIHHCHLQLFPHPIDRIFPWATTACVRATDRLLRYRFARTYSEGIVALGYHRD